MGNALHCTAGSELLTHGQILITADSLVVFDASIHEIEILCAIIFATTHPGKTQFCQFPLTVTAVAHDLGTEYDLAGSASHVTCPLFVTTIYLYWNEIPAGRVTVPSQAGFWAVYPTAESSTAFAAFHEPS